MFQVCFYWPKGLNFILGGVAVAGAVLSFTVLAGPIDLGGFGAPSVRIDDPTGILSPAMAQHMQ